MDFHSFQWILNGSGARMFGGLCHPVPPCKPLCHPVAPDWIPLILRFQILEAWVWRSGCLDAGCWQDWNGLEEVTEVTAFWGEGIGRNSHTLKLQELGGFKVAKHCQMHGDILANALKFAK